MSGGPPQRLGNYKLEKRIGKGGSAEVWLARHRLLPDRTVAIKLLMSQDDEWVERFTREANLTSKLRHQNIIQIYDHGEQAQYHYTVMEYIDGGSLSALLDGGWQPSMELTLHVLRSAGRALDFAHANGVIHRDVSPGNILLERETSRVLLTDFGIARESGNSLLTTVNRVMGTTAYMSPEHFSSARSVTHLSDIYSLGIVLFRLLTGQMPWPYTPGVPDAGGGKFTAPRKVKEVGAENLPADVDRVLQSMLALEPSKRYPSAQAAVDDLEAILTRHTAATRVMRGASRTAAPGGSAALPKPAASAVPTEQQPHAVETVLGPDLLKSPIEDARRREVLLRDNREIAAVLDAWGTQGRLRHRDLGRRAAIHQIRHEKVCIYQLRVLYETREPEQLIEEPLPSGSAPTQEKNANRWELALPPAQEFAEAHAEKVRLPGSIQAVVCEKCAGLGKLTCKRCNGKLLVPAPPPPPAPASQKPAVSAATPRPAPAAAGPQQPGPATAAVPARMIPCPECGGKGATLCERCSGAGNLLRQKTINWRRRPETFDGHDAIGLDSDRQERWVLSKVQAREIYKERCVGGTRPEWEQIPELHTLLERARASTNADTKIVLSEVSISFFPRTELTFDLGGRLRTSKTADGAAVTQPQTFATSIFGFENVLPNNWHFLNWDRVGLLILSAIALILLMLLVYALSALYR